MAIPMPDIPEGLFLRLKQLQKERGNVPLGDVIAEALTVLDALEVVRSRGLTPYIVGEDDGGTVSYRVPIGEND